MRHSYKQTGMETHISMYTVYLYTNARAIVGEYLKEALTHDSCFKI